MLRAPVGTPRCPAHGAASIGQRSAAPFQVGAAHRGSRRDAEFGRDRRRAVVAATTGTNVPSGRAAGRAGAPPARPGGASRSDPTTSTTCSCAAHPGAMATPADGAVPAGTGREPPASEPISDCSRATSAAWESALDDTPASLDWARYASWSRAGRPRCAARRPAQRSARIAEQRAEVLRQHRDGAAREHLQVPRPNASTMSGWWK